MFIRWGKPALIGALCVLASSAFASPGAFESFVKQLFLRTLQDAVPAVPSEAAERSANCYSAFVLQGFTTEELQRLDAYAAHKAALGEDLANKMLTRLVDPQAAKACK
jgi:hypothetical protein